MSDDEAFAFLVSAIIAAAGVWKVIVPLLSVRLFRDKAGRLAIIGALLFCMAGLFLVLRRFAAKDVRDSAGYLALFMTMGGAVQTLALELMPLAGISWRDDALERQNGAALCAIFGVIVGTGCVFAGSNIGEGETIWSTVGPAVFGLLYWAILCAAMEFCSHASEAVAIERDLGSGVRLAGMYAANGIVLAGGLAGDWTSMGEFITTFCERAWPVLPITVVAIVIQRYLHPRVGRRYSVWRAAVLPSMAMVGAAMAFVFAKGG